MTEPSSSSQTGLDDVRATLRDIVIQGQASRSEPIHLTWVGGEFARQKRAPFEQYLNHLVLGGQAHLPPGERKMAPFIELHCSDILKTGKLPNGAVIVAPAEPPPAATPPGAETPALAPPAPTYKFRKGAWLAFIRILAPGMRRFLNLDKLGFTDLASVPSDASGPWQEIERSFILGIGQDEPIDGARVQRLIRDWTAATGVSLERLVDTGEGAPDFHRPSLSDLARLVDSLPPELARQWTIPAEVLRHLRRA